MVPFYIVGPTGSGKSEIAVELARRTGGEIVNADAFQLYRGLETLTAAPGPAQRDAVPHHLYGTVPPDETMDAAAFAAVANPLLDALCKRGTRPIVVSGSGLYVKSLTHGVNDDLPPADQALRDQFRQIPENEIARWLEKLDPVSAATLNLQNPRHVQRALEITLKSGRPASALKSRWAGDAAARRPVEGVFVHHEDRQTLYERIDDRVVTMLAEGAVDEVANLGESLSSTAEKAIGINAIRSFLHEKMSYDEALAQIRQATRRYAKRQLTWFKRERDFQTICLSATDDANSGVSMILAAFPDLITRC